MLIKCRLLESTPKKTSGWKLKCIGLDGEHYTIHTFKDFGYIVGTRNTWEFEVDIKRSQFSKYLVTNKAPSPAKHTRYPQQESALAAYFGRKEPYKSQELTYTWDRVEKVQEDTESLCKGEAGKWIPTTKITTNTEILEKDEKDEFSTRFKDNVWKYGNQPSYYTNPKTGLIQESAGTALLDYAGDNLLNQSEPTGISMYVDSAFAAVALREKHVAEFYTYWAISSYMKQAHKYPRAKIKDVTAFLEAFLVKGRKHLAQDLLDSTAAVGMISIEKGTLSIKSQKDYVRKWEAAYNGRAGNAYRGPRMRRKVWKFGEKTNRWDQTLPTFTDGTILSPLDHPEELFTTHKPYFDIYSARTTKLDTSFAYLLNAPKHEAVAFLYELWVTSQGAYPVCRTRIAHNILISKSTQIRYEQINEHLEKRFNHIEIPQDMLDRMQPSARAEIEKQMGRKFKRSSTGQIYRQEGNSYRSTRIKWVQSKKCSRFRLSRSIIKRYFQVQPVFNESHVSGEVIYSKAKFAAMNKDILKGKPFSKTFVDKKSHCTGEGYFALRRGGVAIPSTDPQNWESFEPQMKYHPINGNRIVPLQTSFVKTNEYRGIYRERDPLYFTSTCISRL